MPPITVSHIVQTSIVTAFTIAAALIWKDVIVDFIEWIIPTNGAALLYKFIAAIVATVLVVIAIYAVLETESEADRMLRKMGRKG